MIGFCRLLENSLLLAGFFGWAATCWWLDRRERGLW